jgi:hypothetical protein
VPAHGGKSAAQLPKKQVQIGIVRSRRTGHTETKPTPKDMAAGTRGRGRGGDRVQPAWMTNRADPNRLPVGVEKDHEERAAEDAQRRGGAGQRQPIQLQQPPQPQQSQKPQLQQPHQTEPLKILQPLHNSSARPLQMQKHRNASGCGGGGGSGRDPHSKNMEGGAWGKGRGRGRVLPAWATKTTAPNKTAGLDDKDTGGTGEGGESSGAPNSRPLLFSKGVRRKFVPPRKL